MLDYLFDECWQQVWFDCVDYVEVEWVDEWVFVLFCDFFDCEGLFQYVLCLGDDLVVDWCYVYFVCVVFENLYVEFVFEFFDCY